MTRTRRLLHVLGLSITVSACAAGDGDEHPEKPPIVEVFACSDYCPGPEEKYLRKVYEGINDRESCEAIGGKPYVYVGWGSTFICLAE